MAETASSQWIPLAATAAALTCLAAGGIWLALRRRAARNVANRLRQAGDDLLAGVLLPNADAGQIHVEYAVLTRREVVVVDVRDIAGHVFGSEGMQDWTVLERNRRFTFPNPLPALYDRVAAVRRLVPEVPVRGVVAFSPRAQFSKGFPPHVVMLEVLLQELTAAKSATDGPPQDVMRAAWSQLGREALPPPAA